MTRSLATLGLSLTLVILAVTGALAHAGLISTTPADGEVLAAAPATLNLTYTEPVSPIAFSLVGVGGTPASLGNWTVDGPAVHVTLPESLASGSYLFSWRVTSEDGHPVNGTVGFAVGAPSGSITAFAADPLLGAAIWLVRALQYVALFLGVGGVAFGLVTKLPDAARRISRRLAITGLVLVPFAIGLDGADLLGPPLIGVFAAAPWSAALGNSYVATEVLLALAFVLALLPGRWATVLAALCGAIAPALSGHASAASPQGLLRVIVFVHIASLLFWIGALLPLMIIIRRGGADALHRFSRLIPYPIAALLLSGLTLAVVQLGPDVADWPSAYGALLVAKLTLVAMLLALAVWNRVRLTTRATTGDSNALRNSIIVELGLAVIVFGIVAGWRFTPPPRVTAEIERANAPAMATVTGDTLTATLTATPGRSGPVMLALALPIDATAATVGLSNPDQGIATISKPAISAGNHQWHVDGVLLPVGGSWDVVVDARTSEFDITTLRGTLILTPLPETPPMNVSSSMAAVIIASSMAMSMPAVASPGLLPSCAPGQVFTQGSITVTGAFARATPKGAASAGAYLAVQNTGATADTLTGASTPAASDATLHSMKMNGNIMQMAPIAGGLPIPPGGSIQLEPDSDHLMLTGMTAPLVEGQCLELTLHFATAGDLPVTLNIGGFAQKTPPGAPAGASSMGMPQMEMSGMSSMPGM